MAKTNPIKGLILAQTADSVTIPLEGFAGAFVRRVSIEAVDAVTAPDANGNTRLIIAAVVDEAGEPVFTVADVEEIEGLKVGVYAGIVAQINRANGLDPLAVEALAKN